MNNFLDMCNAIAERNVFFAVVYYLICIAVTFGGLVVLIALLSLFCGGGSAEW